MNDAPASDDQAPQPLCPLCGRALLPGSNIDQHHLIPKSRKGREKVTLHRICHSAIHAALAEKELARRYNTIETLIEHPDIRRFIEWVRTKPPEFHVRTHGRGTGGRRS